ncbi:Flagellar basal-body rod modification protein FlgD [hydrothermal vent metagenome]|uniref:Flagellar basal-body rod modification protein FlgD n=1 Tax=hydrothermal vent metagenome TaxID=652676 RepID=A0A3B0S7D1_9ZZZZ
MPGINSIGQAVNTSNLSQSSTGLADNFDTFLTLLTTQLQNQDPLSPLDSTEFVGQLVQFSSVEQQISQNRNLESLIRQSEVNSSTAAVSFIGKEVLLSTASATLQDGTANWGYALDRASTSTSIIISDSAGKVVFTGEGATNAGVQQLVWDGRDNSGIQLPDGVYSAQITAQDADGTAVGVSTSITAIATGVDFSGDEPALLLGNIRASFADILSVRQTSTS